MKRKFEIKFTVTAKLELDQEVIDNVDDNWRDMFYDMYAPEEYAPEEIAEMIAYNILRGSNLSSIDGFANLEDKQAELFEIDYTPEEINEI